MVVACRAQGPEQLRGRRMTGDGYLAGPIK